MGGTAGLVALALITAGAVLTALWFVIIYAKVGPIPGAKVVRPVDDLGGLVGSHDGNASK